jgi:DNA-binding response OmpR family regulator
MNIALHTNDALATRRIAQLLEAAGARCQCFGTSDGVMHATHHGGFDVALIDTRQTREADDTLLAWVRGRAAAATTAIVLLSSDPRAESVVRALEAGADDVVLMPSPPEVIAARVRAVHRRARNVQEDHHRVHLAGYTLDRNTGGAQDRERPVHLTPREFSIAWFLFSRPCSFVSRDSIGMAVWGLQADIAEHTIEQHIYMLRKKLQLSRDRGVWIRAAYGRGYRLEVRAATARAPLEDAPHAGALAMIQAIETGWSRG